MRATAILLVAAVLAGCGKDPFAGRKKDGEKRPPIESRDVPTNAERYERGVVDAYERLVIARGKRDAAGWKAAFAGEPGEDAASLYEETTNAKVVRIHHQFQGAEVAGERATVTVKEIVEERDPKGGVFNSEVTVTATLVRTGGAWMVEALRADWK
ncbi:MAG: hypothetical protein IT452_07655 [Planctomycetia bacterium]|nr:hypothetical protein [Planctomycetia bacterium]